MIAPPASALCRYDASSIAYRGRDLVAMIAGGADFINVFLAQTFAAEPTPAQRTIVNAVLVCLMEHGMTPSAIAARLVYSSSPENLQGGVAAGLLAVGSRFVGTTEDCAALLQRIVTAPDCETAAREIAAQHREQRNPVPGFGHHLHVPDDPRADALRHVTRDIGTAGAFAAALDSLAQAVDDAAGRHITVNATGAVAAALGDIGIPVRMMRGFALLARTAGLIAHLAEEQLAPTDRWIWHTVDEASRTAMR